MIKKLLILGTFILILTVYFNSSSMIKKASGITDDIAALESGFVFTAYAEEQNEDERKIPIPFEPVELEESFKNFEKIDNSKIVKIYEEQEYENFKIIYYKYSDDINRAAYSKGDDIYYCISGDISHLSFDNRPGNIKIFENILGKNKGFSIDYGGGAICSTYVYYYMENDELKVLTVCDNVRDEYDIDNDAYKELLTGGGLPAYNGILDLFDGKVQQCIEIELDSIKDKLDQYLDKYIVGEKQFNNKYLVYDSGKGCFEVTYYVRENDKTVLTATIDLYYRNNALYFTR